MIKTKSNLCEYPCAPGVFSFMKEIAHKVFFLQGHKNGAIYNLNTSDVFSINDVACQIIRNAIANNPLSDSEKSYLIQLRENKLWEDSFSPSNLLKHATTTKECFDVVWLEITQACNMRCIHCYEGCNHVSASANQRIKLAEWLNLIDQVAELGTKRVVVIGGEPTVDKNLKPILSYLSKKNLKTTLFTNASFDDEDLIDIVSNCDIKVKFSIYGHTPVVHDAVTGHPGSFSLLVRNIKQLLTRGVSVSAAVVLMRENEAFKKDIEDFLISLGVEHYKFDVIREVFSGNQSNHVPILPETIKIAKISEPYFVLTEERFLLFNDKNTCWNRKLVITETGSFLPCVFARDSIIGNMHDMPLKSLLESPTLKYYWGFSFKNIVPCNECEFRYACKDCRPLAMSLCGDIAAKNPRCCYNPITGEWQRE